MSGRRDQHEADPPRRTEPTLGDIDHLDSPRVPASDGLPHVSVEARQGRSATRPQRHSRRHRRRGWLVPLLLLVLIGLGATLWLNQGWLRQQVPRTELNDVLTRAQQALQIGHLDGHDGTSARELFQQVADQQPDNDRALDGLRQIGQAELAQADAALQAGHVDQASQLASASRELLGGGTDIDRLDAQISQARTTRVPAVDLVDEAQQALAAGTLDGPHGAGALYRQVLQSDPGNAVAAHGLDQVSDALAVQARKAFDANDAATANASVEELAALQPNNGALPSLRALQAQNTKQDNGALDTALKQGMDALRSGHIAGDGNDTAVAYFKAALVLDPDNADAKSGLGKVAQALTVQANAALDAGDTTQASRLLDQASALAPKSADIAAARARLNSLARTTANTVGNAGGNAGADAGAAADDSLDVAAPVILSPQQIEAVAKLVQRAQAAAARGDIMLPPGNSAYDLYRNALVMDGNNTAALQGLKALPTQVEKQFDRALASQNLSQASDMLSNLSELAPGDAGQAALGQRLGIAWLDQAEQQLDRGDRAGAAQSIDRARKLAPNQPRLQDVAARLQSGNP